MSVIRDYIKSQLIDPLKNYPTTIQDTMINIIIDRIESLYEYSRRFPEIISPNSNRLDILQAILKQFQFSIREEANLQEQLSILENILYVYSKRGSIDTIENMWKYYGGDLPKDIKVNIPSYNLFRYSVSKYSGKNVYPDKDTYRSGVYEVVLNNNTYPVSKLKEFMLRELVAAGNRVYFTNSMYSILTSDQESAYKYEVHHRDIIEKQLRTITYRSGMTFSGAGGYSLQRDESLWSGKPDLFLELIKMMDLGEVILSNYDVDDLSVLATKTDYAHYIMNYVSKHEYKSLFLEMSYTPESTVQEFERYLYGTNGEVIEFKYPGYFILGSTLLGREVW